MYLKVALKKIFMYNQVMNFLIKTFVVTIVISLMPIVISELAPEYDGFNIEAAETKKKKTRKRVCKQYSLSWKKKCGMKQ